MRTVVFLVAMSLAPALGCKSSQPEALPVPASSEPEGRDLVAGAIVAAFETVGTPPKVRLYKVIEVKYFPPPMSDAIIMVAYNETGADFQEAARLYQQGGLTVAIANVDVQRHLFRRRDYRVLANAPVTSADLSAQPVDPPKPDDASKR